MVWGLVLSLSAKLERLKRGKKIVLKGSAASTEVISFASSARSLQVPPAAGAAAGNAPLWEGVGIAPLPVINERFTHPPFLLPVFAYGATGAGKTSTMLGSETSPGIPYLTMVELD